MTRKLTLVGILALLFSLSTEHCSAQLAQNLKEHISYLASDSLHGRMTGSVDEKKAADYIIAELRKAGVTNLKGSLSAKKYLQKFHYAFKLDSAGKKTNGNNVIGYIDNGAEYTIVIGAHYDHLGWGLPAHSAYRGESAIHNGADDNASGVAAVIELARTLKTSAYKHHNYLFVAFSGEELGLFGSKWFVQHSKIPLQKISYMLNFDMIGRVDSNKMVINGVGTSPFWNETLKTVQTPLHIKTTESGVGPSDHTSFYLKNIPVLHFFSGQHKDYHKPSDDESKINYKGIEETIELVMEIIASSDDKGKLVFTKTKDESNENTPKFTVTLGVMPDYTFDGEGMRIDGITAGKPAANAGLQEGDIVTQLGETRVSDMMSYMKALSQFKKGDRTTVKVKRGVTSIEKEIQF